MGGGRRELTHPNRDREGAATAAAPRSLPARSASMRRVPPLPRPEPGIPFAYFIPFRCYGTWLHGDGRGSVDRVHNGPGTEPLPPGPRREELAAGRLRQPPAALGDRDRAIVADAIRERCSHAGWDLLALNVRTEHVHLVVRAGEPPELVMGSLKSWSTRALVGGGERERGQRVWSRHGSTRYLWTEESTELACGYVTDGQ